MEIPPFSVPKSLEPFIPVAAISIVVVLIGAIWFARRGINASKPSAYIHGSPYVPQKH